MSTPVVVRIEATWDIEDIRDVLDAQTPGLGQTFLDRVNDVLVRIATMPEMYACVWQDVRAARIRRFPHVLYYRVYPDRAEVFAVIHGGRSPSSWRSRA